MREHALNRLESLARERRDHGLAAQISQARAEAEAGQFTLAALGQFKRGKSTLLNALVGRPLLPMDVAPLTSTITVMAEGSPERGEVLFQNGQTRTVAFGDVAAFVTEEGNPGNRLGVQAVLLYLQSPLLSRGIRLVDTPGVGSVFGLNSAVTKAFLPRIDVALIVLGGDPPITGDELELVRSAAPRAGKLIFVMNRRRAFSRRFGQGNPWNTPQGHSRPWLRTRTCGMVASWRKRRGRPWPEVSVSYRVCG